jgi:hypothetical protein
MYCTHILRELDAESTCLFISAQGPNLRIIFVAIFTAITLITAVL